MIPKKEVMMKCLTIRPEYAYDILEGRKTIEYRTWSTDHRGPLVIHAARPEGFLLCLVDLTDVRFNKKMQVYEWTIANPRTLKNVPIRGRLKLWNVPRKLVKVLE